MNQKELDLPLYHGTFTTFTVIDLSQSAPKKDFGRGFYTTNDIVQAKKFARLKAAREASIQGHVLSFELLDSIDLSIKVFKQSDAQWFDFVLRNRGFAQFTNSNKNENYDIVIGPVANDAVGIVLNNFIDGVYGDQTMSEAKDTAIRLLLTQKLHNQIFFGTQRAVDQLVFREAMDVCPD